jgi:hypothetical protein
MLTQFTQESGVAAQKKSAAVMPPRINTNTNNAIALDERFTVRVGAGLFSSDFTSVRGTSSVRCAMRSSNAT